MSSRSEGPPLLVTSVIGPAAATTPAEGPVAAPDAAPGRPANRAPTHAPDAAAELVRDHEPNPGPNPARQVGRENLFERFDIGPRVLVSASGHTFLVTDKRTPDGPRLAAKLFTSRYSAHVRAGRDALRAVAETAQHATGALPHLHFVDEPEDCLLMVADAPGGVPLDQVLMNAPTGLAPGLAQPMIAQLAGGLGMLHGLGFVHGDVRPSSVFIDETAGRAMLADWGHAIPVHLSLTDARTMPGNTLDGVQYASLEVLSGSLPRREDDVFALGCVAYEMLSGTHPFERRTASEVESLGLSPQPLAALNELQNDLLLRALAPRRHERNVSLTELATAFGSARPRSAEHGASTARRKPVIAVAASACVAVAAAAAVMWRGGAEPGASGSGETARATATMRAASAQSEPAARIDAVPVPPTGLEGVRRSSGVRPTALEQVSPESASPGMGAVVQSRPASSDGTPNPTPATAETGTRADDPAVMPQTRERPAIPATPREEEGASGAGSSRAAPTAARGRVTGPERRATHTARRSGAGTQHARKSSPLQFVSSCPACDCRSLYDKRTFTFEPLRENERRFLSQYCRG